MRLFLLILAALAILAMPADDCEARRRASPYPVYDEDSGSAKEAADRAERIRKAVFRLEKVKDRYRVYPSNMPSIWPVHGTVTSLFGMRRSPFTGKMRFHAGMDIGAKTGTPIIAPADGTVIHSGKDGGYGNSVEIWHSEGLVTRHAHMSRTKAREGQRVKRGDVIGYVGSTGRSTGPHLHYEVLVAGEPTNPMRHILSMR